MRRRNHICVATVRSVRVGLSHEVVQSEDQTGPPCGPYACEADLHQPFVDIDDMPVVQFAQFSSIVQPTLWHELSRLKLEVLRLSDESVPLTATYSTGRTIKDRNTGQEVTLGCNIAVGGEGFSESYRSVCPGVRSCAVLIMPAHLCTPFRLGGS
jgi:hypothetical protein